MSRFSQGHVIGEYTIIEEIGHGKFSDVYAVSHKEITDTRLCIKIQRNNESSHEASEDEIEFLKKINFDYGGHENIIKMISTFEHEGLICIVYQRYYCDLLDYLHNYHPTGMPVELASKIMEQVLSGLKFLHSKNLVHTDIKPDNILLACDPDNNCTAETIKIVIADFGTMRKVDGVDYSDHLATPEYQAPEVIVGYPYDTGLDIWAVACTFYELLIGDFLFDTSDDKLDNEMSENYSEDSSWVTDDESQNSKNSKSHLIKNNDKDNDEEDEDDDETEIMYNLIHLYYMNKLIGDFPEEMIKNGHYSGYYFNRANRLRGNLYQDEESMRELLLKKFDNSKTTGILIEFFSKSLVYLPQKRANATILLATLQRIISALAT